MLEVSQYTGNFVLPTPQGGEVELSREYYRFLIEDGGLTPRQLSTLTAAAQILEQVSSHEPLSLVQIVGRMREDQDAVPSSTERRALDALLAAELVSRRVVGVWLAMSLRGVAFADGKARWRGAYYYECAPRRVHSFSSSRASFTSWSSSWSWCICLSHICCIRWSESRPFPS